MGSFPSQRAEEVSSPTRMQDTHDLLRARWCEPTLSIVDVRVGDDEVNSQDPHYRFGPTRFSVIPRLAVGNIRCAFQGACLSQVSSLIPFTG